MESFNQLLIRQVKAEIQETSLQDAYGLKRTNQNRKIIGKMCRLTSALDDSQNMLKTIFKIYKLNSCRLQRIQHLVQMQRQILRKYSMSIVGRSNSTKARELIKSFQTLIFQLIFYFTTKSVIIPTNGKFSDYSAHNFNLTFCINCPCDYCC